MPENSSELAKRIESFAGVPIVVVGDLMMDHYIWGPVSRVSPEAPVVVVNVSEENKQPGGAGNTARNLATLGAKVSVCGIVGDDEDGRELVSMFEQLGINTNGVLVDRSRPTTSKTRVIAQHQQVVRFDRESTAPLDRTFAEGLGAAMEEKFKTSKGVILSDYCKGAICEPIFKRVKAAQEKGEIGFGKVPILVDPKEENFNLYQGVTVIKPNRGEAERASGIVINDRKKAIEAGKVLLSKWDSEMVLITLGEYGMVLVSNVNQDEPTIEIDTVAREVYDVSGAGDTVAAVFTLGLATGATAREAAELANVAAGIVVGEVGTATVTGPELKQALLRGN